MIYTPEYFLKKFEAIPDEFFEIEWVWFNGPKYRSQYDMLHYIFRRNGLILTHVVDGDLLSYPQPTAKLRILAALTDIINKQKQNG